MVSLAAPEEPVPPPLYVAITGHRPDKLGGWKIPNPLYDLTLMGLYSAFQELRPTYVITGMSLGVDQWAAELCINMGIPFVAAVPFAGQDGVWIPAAKAKYQWLLSKAAVKYIICEGGFEPWKMQERNKWMVRSCHRMVAVWNGTSGGTANCLKYAAEVGKPVDYVPLPPAGMEVGEFFQKTYGALATKEIPAAVAATGKRVVEI